MIHTDRDNGWWWRLSFCFHDYHVGQIDDPGDNQAFPFQPLLQPADRAGLHRHLLCHRWACPYRHQNMGFGDYHHLLGDHWSSWMLLTQNSEGSVSAIFMIPLSAERIISRPTRPILGEGSTHSTPCSSHTSSTLCHKCSRPPWSSSQWYSGGWKENYQKYQKANFRNWSQPGPVHCSVPPLLGLHRPGCISKDRRNKRIKI